MLIAERGRKERERVKKVANSDDWEGGHMSYDIVLKADRQYLTFATQFMPW